MNDAKKRFLTRKRVRNGDSEVLIRLNLPVMALRVERAIVKRPSESLCGVGTGILNVTRCDRYDNGNFLRVGESDLKTIELSGHIEVRISKTHRSSDLYSQVSCIDCAARFGRADVDALRIGTGQESGGDDYELHSE